MKKATISIICAIGKNGEIGSNGKIPWQIPEDLDYFKMKTTGHVIIMGSRTFKSIGKPLPNRTNFVITRDENFSAEGVVVTHSISEALKKAQEVERGEIFIIGGGEIYKQTIGLANKLYLTVISKKFEADTFFPDYSEFNNVVSERKSSDENFEYTFLELER